MAVAMSQKQKMTFMYQTMKIKKQGVVGADQLRRLIFAENIFLPDKTRLIAAVTQQCLWCQMNQPSKFRSDPTAFFVRLLSASMGAWVRIPLQSPVTLVLFDGF